MPGTWYKATFKRLGANEFRAVCFECDTNDYDALEGAAIVAFQREYPSDHSPLKWLNTNIEEL